MSYVNPVLALPSMRQLQNLPKSVREPLRQILRELALEACTKAERSWKRRKGPMAAYWRSVSVYAGHIARALR